MHGGIINLIDFSNNYLNVKWNHQYLKLAPLDNISSILRKKNTRSPRIHVNIDESCHESQCEVNFRFGCWKKRGAGAQPVNHGKGCEIVHEIKYVIATNHIICHIDIYNPYVVQTRRLWPYTFPCIFYLASSLFTSIPIKYLFLHRLLPSNPPPTLPILHPISYPIQSSTSQLVGFLTFGSIANFNGVVSIPTVS